MNRFISVIGFLFLATCVIVVPMTVLRLWDIAFAANLRPGTLESVVELITWLVVGFGICLTLVGSRRKRLLRKVKAVAPIEFHPVLQLFDPHDNSYFGVFPKEQCVVIVDAPRKIARREPLDFIQSWTIEEDSRGARIILSFNSYEYSSIKIPIAASQSHDLAAKLNLAFRG